MKIICEKCFALIRVQKSYSGPNCFAKGFLILAQQYVAEYQTA